MLSGQDKLMRVIGVVPSASSSTTSEREYELVIPTNVQRSYCCSHLVPFFPFFLSTIQQHNKSKK